MSDAKKSTTTTKPQDAGEQKSAKATPSRDAASAEFAKALEQGYYGEKPAKEGADGK